MYPVQADADGITAGPWRGFTGGCWRDRIDVRDFIQANVTPYSAARVHPGPPGRGEGTRPACSGSARPSGFG